MLLKINIIQTDFNGQSQVIASGANERLTLLALIDAINADAVDTDNCTLEMQEINY